MSKKSKSNVVSISSGVDPAIAELLDSRDTMGLRLNDKRKPIGCLENVVKILQSDSAWRGVLAYNEFSCAIEKRAKPPYENATLGEWTERDDDALDLWFSKKFDVRAGNQNCARAVGLVASYATWHPVREYVESTNYDGKKRVDAWLMHYLGARVPDDDRDLRSAKYYELAGRWWLISAIARIYKPGCKADHLLLLEGRQGAGKSTALATLFGDWFSDTPLHIGNKDSYGALRGVWGYELAELDAFNRAESSASKAFFSARQDKYRPPYGHRDISVPRQNVFAGTTNQDQYLRDSTGNRRYWPVRCGEIRLRGPESIEADRDQLWAEALTLYNEGAVWYPTGEDEVAIFREQQAERELGDVYEELIYKGTLNRDEISMSEIFADILDTEPAKMTKAEQTRIGEVMKRLNWVKERPSRGGIRGYVYIRAGTRPAPADDDVPF